MNLSTKKVYCIYDVLTTEDDPFSAAFVAVFDTKVEAALALRHFSKEGGFENGELEITSFWIIENL